ncbi:MAG: sugar ABC transporter substrate-binding protein [Spirochaetota bacterium]
MRRVAGSIAIAFLLSLALGSVATAQGKIKIGVAFESLESQFWVANHAAIIEKAKAMGIEVVEAIADSDQNKQNQQLENFIAMGVKGVIGVSRDNAGIVPAIKKLNKAGIPFIANNRPAAEGADVALTVISDSYTMAKGEAQWLVDFAKRNNTKLRVLEFVGDLKDLNAVKRQKGFEEVVNANKNWITIVNTVPTEWKPELALAGTVNLLSGNTQINCIFTPSDYLLPAIVSGLQQVDKWKKFSEAGHITLATFDGAEDALDYIRDGYSDVCMVQDAIWTGEQCVEAIVKLAKGQKLPAKEVVDGGFIVNRDNFATMSPKAWGYVGRK